MSKATDIYALGAVLYFLLTGRPPFTGNTSYETIRHVLETEPRSPRLLNPGVDRDLAAICLKCLEKDPARRYVSALELAEDLERWLGHEPVRARRSSLLSRARKWMRRNLHAVVLCSLGILLAGTLTFIFWNREPPPPPAGIAVLPFANLDGVPENTAFADALQNDILNRLARNGNMKVIDRATMMKHRRAHNARELGRVLNVSHVLEGSLRREGHRIHVDAELVDTRLNQPIWSEEFERELDDLLSVQAGIADDVAEVLLIKLAPAGQASSPVPVSKDTQANDLYALGAPIVDSSIEDSDVYSTSNSDVLALRHGIQLLGRAVALDPRLLPAYYKLAKAHDFLTFATDSRGDRASAKRAIDAATRLAPNSAPTHLARALHFYWSQRNYQSAQAELSQAAKMSPHDAGIFKLKGYIHRREGRWEEAIKDFQHALDLDPGNMGILHALEVTYNHLRRYEEEGAILDRGLAVNPHQMGLRMHRAGIELRSRGDFESVSRILEEFISENPAAMREVAWGRFQMALFRRDLQAATELLSRAEGSNQLSRAQDIDFPHSFFDGWLAQMKGDTKAAQEHFAVARAEEEKEAPNQPVAKRLVTLGLIDAFLGRKQQAMAEGRQALELMPISKDAWDGPQILFCSAAICAWSGERDLALSQVQKLAVVPAGVHYGHLVLDPLWDPLRQDPRFGKIVKSLAPK